MEVVIPLLMAKLIDEGIDGAGGMDAVMHYGWILLVCCVLSLIFGALAGHFAAFASAGFARNLRARYVLSVSRSIPFPTSISFPQPASSPV